MKKLIATEAAFIVGFLLGPVFGATIFRWFVSALDDQLDWDTSCLMLMKYHFPICSGILLGGGDRSKSLGEPSDFLFGIRYRNKLRSRDFLPRESCVGFGRPILYGARTQVSCELAASVANPSHWSDCRGVSRLWTSLV